MAIEILTFPAGPIETNAYLVLDGQGRAMAIDAPGDVTETMLGAASATGSTIEAIVITHPHWDHIQDAAALKTATGATVYAHPGAQAKLAEPGSTMFRLPAPIPPVTADVEIDEGDTVTLGGETFDVWFLPGHEPSHIVLLHAASGTVLGGDVLFPRGHGRVDLPDADPAAMRRSLARLAALPAETIVYPGHGAPTTIAAEADWLPR
jgi:hydroxyacylglutathione hydrolase